MSLSVVNILIIQIWSNCPCPPVSGKSLCHGESGGKKIEWLHSSSNYWVWQACNCNWLNLLVLTMFFTVLMLFPMCYCYCSPSIFNVFGFDFILHAWRPGFQIFGYNLVLYVFRYGWNSNMEYRKIALWKKKTREKWGKKMYNKRRMKWEKWRRKGEDAQTPKEVIWTTKPLLPGKHAKYGRYSWAQQSKRDTHTHTW